MQAQNKVAVTMDDFPLQRIETYKGDSFVTVFNNLLEKVKSEKIPVIAFVNGIKLTTDGNTDPRKVNLIENWLNAGLDISNHTYTHKGANLVPVAEYEEDIINGEKAIKALADKTGKKIKYFRHPYLQTGLTLITKQAIDEFLVSHGYTIAPVTIDNAEWVFGKAYEEAYNIGDTDMMNKIGNEYLSYMDSKIAYWEKESNALFGRNISQILLIHGSRLNSEYFSKLMDVFRARSYTFISLDEALKDDAYKSADRFIRNAGISWLHRWAITAGKTREFFAGEPECPAHILKYAKVEGE